MTTFLDAESGVETSVPREGFKIELPYVTYRLCPHDQDEVINGETYRASAVTRGEIGISSITGSRVLSFSLPIAHPICQRWMANGTPPYRVAVTFYRKQTIPDITEQVWTGYIIAAAFEGISQLRFQVDNLLGRLMKRRLPTISADTLCGHVLFDDNCRAVRDDYEIPSNVAAGTVGLKIVVTSVAAKPDGWFDNGEMRELASGERMPIISHVGNTLTILAPIYGLKLGSELRLFPGCARSVEICFSKFNNVPNFSGFPDMPDNGLFNINTYGFVDGTGTVES